MKTRASTFRDRGSVFWVGLVFVVASLRCCFADDSPPMSAEKMFEKLVPTVVVIHVVKNNGESQTATGFLHEKAGFGITAWHVLENAAMAEAKFMSGAKIPIPGFIDRHSLRDIVLFPIDSPIPDRPRFMKGIPKIGAKVYAIGSPEGLEFSITDGILSQIRDIAGIRQYQISCPISRGNSGGPILNDAGEVLGICSWQMIGGQNLNFACPIEYAKDLDETKPITRWAQMPKAQWQNTSHQSPSETAKQLAILWQQLPRMIEKLEKGDISGYLQDFYHPPELKTNLNFPSKEEMVAAIKSRAPFLSRVLRSLDQKEPMAILQNGIFIFPVPDAEQKDLYFNFIFNRTLKKFFVTHQELPKYGPKSNEVRETLPPEQLAILHEEFPPIIAKLRKGDVIGYIQDYFQPHEVEAMTPKALDDLGAKIRPKAEHIARLMQGIVDEKDPVVVKRDGKSFFNIPDGPVNRAEFPFVFDPTRRRFFSPPRIPDKSLPRGAGKMETLTSEQIAVFREQVPPMVRKLRTGDVRGYIRDYFHPKKVEKMTSADLEELVNRIRPNASRLADTFQKFLDARDLVVIIKEGKTFFGVSLGRNTWDEMPFFYDASLKRFFGSPGE